jgi:curved DNA-binding protein
MPKRDYYDILGISKKASADEIKKAHRKLVRQYHPDVNKNNKSAEEKFKEVQEAYDVLSDPTKRANYDQFGHAGVGVDPGDPFRRNQAAGRSGARTQWRAGPNVSVEDFDVNGGGGFGDIFEQLFGGARGGTGGGRGRSRQQAPPPPQRGADLEHEVTLTFMQAVRGVTLPLQIDREGKRETIEIKIPAGVNDGSRIRIKGRGHGEIGSAGDLFIITRVLPHDYFRREGLDIFLDLPISVYDALLGAKVDVPTLDGSMVQMTIPPGTNSGAKLRLKGRGIERGEEKGDQFVTIKILVPKGLDAEDETTIRALAAKHPIDTKSAVKWT